MAKKKHTILKHLTNLKALEQEVSTAVERQRDDERIAKQDDTKNLLDQVGGTLATQIGRLGQRIDALGGETTTGELKEGLAKALGAIEGLWEKLREEPVSSALRDDYAALNLVAIQHTALHAVARALDDRTTADLAFQNLRELTPLVVEISQVVPLVVVAEAADEHEGVDLGVATEAARTTHQAWQPDVAKS